MRRWIVVPLLLLAQPTMLSAQAPDDSTFEMRALARWIESYGRPEADALPAQIATLAGLRFQAVGDVRTPSLDSALALSVMSFGKLKDSPWGWFALARQLQVTRGSCAQAGARDWLNYCRRVADGYRIALDRDSTFIPVFADLLVRLPWPTLWEDPLVDYGRMQAVLAHDAIPVPAHAALERRRLLLATELLDTTFIDTAIDSAGGAEITAGERAFLRSRRAAGHGDGIASVEFYIAAAADTMAGDHLEWMRQDIDLIGTPVEVATWDTLPAGERRSWLESFWNDRDFADARAPGSRMVDYVTNRHRAYIKYRAVLGDEAVRGGASFRVQDRFCEVDGEENALTALVLGCGFDRPKIKGDIFDGRGRVLMRHGEPQQSVNYPGMNNFTAESWLYTTEQGPLVIHFGRGFPIVTGMHVAAVPQGDWMSACQVTPRFCVLEANKVMGIPIPPERMRMVVERGREEMDQLLTTDGDPQRFAQALKVNIGSYGLGLTASRLTLAADVPLQALRELAGDSARSIALRWQVRIRHSDGTWAVSEDTVQRVALPRRIDKATDKDAFLTLSRELVLGAGQYDLRVVLSDTADRAGATYSRNGITILGRDGNPGLSDLVLMPDGAQGAARRIEGTTVHISPTFTPGGASFVRVGYVLAGLEGASVPVSVSVVRQKEDNPEETLVAVAFVDRPISNRDFRQQRVGVAQLKSGGYDLVVRVTMPDGTIAERRQRIVVR